jgi:hypothetical protein
VRHAVRFAAVVMGVLGLALAPASASAQQPQQPVAATAVAEGLFQQARDLVKLGRYDEACPKLAESQRLDPKLGTLLNLAVCHEKQGKTATAWAEYTSAATIARREGQREREDFAREQVATLEKKLPRLVLQSSAAGAPPSVTLDDQLMSSAALGTPLPIDPGKHRVLATAPGKKAWSKEIDVPAERTEIPVSIPALEADELPVIPPLTPPAPVPVAPPVLVPLAPVPVPPPSPPPRNDAVVLMGAGFGVAGAGILVGAIAGVVALAQAGTIKNQCSATGQCQSSEQDSINGATTLANVSNVGFGIGAAGLVVGIVGLVLRPRDPAPRTGHVRLSPFVGPGTAGLGGTF